MNITLTPVTLGITLCVALLSALVWLTARLLGEAAKVARLLGEAARGLGRMGSSAGSAAADLSEMRAFIESLDGTVFEAYEDGGTDDGPQ